MAVQNGPALATALDLVKTALESGALKLRGPSGGDWAESDGKGDATYLISLLTALQAELPKG